VLESRAYRSDPDVPRAWLIGIAVAFVAAHAILAALDFNRPEVFLRADRAAVRMSQIHTLLAMHSWPEARDYLGSHGILGDYAVHAILYAIGGKPFLILFQILLLLGSGAGVTGLPRLLGLAPRSQAIALGVYFLLPHSLVLPHQLATEALQVPLLVISTWLFCLSMRDDDLWLLLSSAVLLALATLIRPVTLAWPLVVFMLAVLFGRKGFGAVFLAVAGAPVLLWMSFVWETTGAFGLGESSHSLAHNLYLRVAEVAASMPEPQARELVAQHLTQGAYGRMGIGEYLQVALQYPRPFAAAVARDAAVFWGKSGIERLTVDYAGSEAEFVALTNRDIGWRKHLDTGSSIATLRYVWRLTGPVLLISLTASALLIAMVALAVHGAAALIRALHGRLILGASSIAATLLIVLPIYIFTCSLVVMSVRSGHRAPAEFALVILAVYGWHRWSTPRPAPTPESSRTGETQEAGRSISAAQSAMSAD
jgi:hypothetical protein